MKTNRRTALTLCVLLALAMAAPAAAQDRVDLVVLLDSSQSMIPYFNQVVDYVVSGTLKEYMRFGDAFHLISFADSTQVELAQVLRSEDDLKAALARLYLLYPLGKNTDLVGALRNTYQYVSDLPEAGMKYIVLITDGMHSPSDGSPSAALSPEQVAAEIQSIAGKVRERGWVMRIVRVPFSAEAASAAGGQAGGEPAGNAPGSGNYLDTVAGALGVSPTDFDPENGAAALDGTIALPRISFEADLGKRDYSFKLPFTVNNASSQGVALELESILLEDGRDILKDTLLETLGPGETGSFSVKVLLPADIPEGTARITVEPRFADGLRVSPARSELALELKRAPFAAFFRNTARAALFLGLLALALVLLFVALRYVRGVHRRSERPIVEAVIDSQARSAQPAAVRPASQAAAIRPDARDAASLLAGSASSSRGRDSARTLAEAGSRQDRAAAILAGAAKSADGRPAEAASDSRDAAALLAGMAGSARNRDAGALLAEAAGPGHKAEAERAAGLLASWSATLPRSAAPSQAVKPATARPAFAESGPIAYSPVMRKPGAARFELFVAGQNTNIGSRNIKTMHAGGRKTVGGKSSDFLVFLLPVPQRVADLHYDGENLTLVPVKRAFFPAYDGPIQDCLGQDIAMVNARGRELVLRFERYVPPLEGINKLLHCIDSPGVPAAESDEGQD